MNQWLLTFSKPSTASSFTGMRTTKLLDAKYVLAAKPLMRIQLSRKGDDDEWEWRWISCGLSKTSLVPTSALLITLSPAYL